MCSSPELLAEEMDHLGKVLRYNNNPKWMIEQGSRNNSPAGRLIDPETGNEVKKSVFISAPYFPGLSESFKQLLRYTRVQVCFKSQNTIKLMLMHPKDKVDPSLKKDIVYQWSCTSLGCKSSYIVNMSKNTANKVPTLLSINIVTPKAIHSLTLINYRSVIDQEKSQIAWEAKEAIHI